jgi:hypothetical protein
MHVCICSVMWCSCVNAYECTCINTQVADENKVKQTYVVSTVAFGDATIGDIYLYVNFEDAPIKFEEDQVSLCVCECTYCGGVSLSLNINRCTHMYL